MLEKTRVKVVKPSTQKRKHKMVNLTNAKPIKVQNNLNTEESLEDLHSATLVLPEIQAALLQNGKQGDQKQTVVLYNKDEAG